MRSKRRITSDDETDDRQSIDSCSDSQQHKRAKLKRVTRNSTKSQTSSESCTEESEPTAEPAKKNRKLKKNLSSNPKDIKNKKINISMRNSDKSQPKIVTLTEWIIQPHKELQCVNVEGKRKDIDAYWKSSSIAKRVDAKTVITDSGTTYKLIGKISKLDSIDSGFPPKLIKLFTSGFPKKWEELIEMFYNGEFAEDDNIRSQKRVAKLDATIVGTPGGQIIDITQLPQTRSGRIVKPALAAWAGQRIEYDSQTGAMKVVYNTKYAESVFTQQDVQLSAKTVRRKAVKKPNTSDAKNKKPDKQRKSPAEKSKQDKEDLIEDVLTIIGSSKEKRNLKRLSQSRNTCYNGAASRMHMKDRAKEDSSNSDASPKSKLLERTSDIDSTESEPVTKPVRQKPTKASTKINKKNASSKVLREETNSATESRPKRHIKQTSRQLQESEESVSDSELVEITFKEPVKESKTIIWDKMEKKRLESALTLISPNDKNLWKRLADAVKTKTEQNCEDFIRSEKKYKPFVDSIKTTVEKKMVQVTAKKGTMKRRRQIKEMLEYQLQKEDEMDITNATPFRAKGRKMALPDMEEDDDIFGGEDFPITPGTNYRTPSFKQSLAQFSAKKTPATSVPSPVTNTIKKKNAEKVVHNYLKNRKQQKNKPVKKKESIPISNKPRTLFCPNKVDGSIFEEDEKTEDDDEDEDEDKDYYWSDN